MHKHLVRPAFLSGLALVLALASVASLASCAAGGGGGGEGSAASTAAMEENAIVHTVTDDDRAFAASKQAITADSAILWVNGLGCPQCATNIDLQLERMRGVNSVNVDLSNGKVTVGLSGDRRPSPAQLGKAVGDAGFTLVKVETN